MKPVKFPEANSELVAPPGREDEVLTLPVFKNGEQVISCWEPSDEEIARIVETRKVYLAVVGQTHPPLYLTADAFQNSDDDVEELAFNAFMATLDKGLRLILRGMLEADKKFGFVTLDTNEGPDASMLMISLDPRLSKAISGWLKNRFGANTTKVDLEDDERKA